MKRNTPKWLYLTLATLIVLCTVTFAVPALSKKTSAPQAMETVLIKEGAYGVAAGISPDSPDENFERVESLVMTNAKDEQTLQTLLRMPLPHGITPEQLQTATLRLKPMDGEPGALSASAVQASWDRLDVTWNALQGHVQDAQPTRNTSDADGWQVLDVTDIVRGWLSGVTSNSGFLLEETEAGHGARYNGPYDETGDEQPELIITFTPDSAQEGSYAYEAQSQGNCLSFALRDTDAILATDLGLDMDTMSEIYADAGEDGLLAYVNERMLAYVDTHAAALKIDAIRALPAFDAEIDPETEYRIALRIGVEEGAEGIVAFDFHLQVQLPDGSWAEKFGASDSWIVPGSNRALAPGAFTWHQNEFWGLSRWNDFYDSDTLYFAVSKQTTGFTAHRQ